MKKVLMKLTALLLCLSTLTVAFTGCSPKVNGGNNDNNDSEDDYMNEAICGAYTSDQLKEIKYRLEAGDEPWKSAYADLLNYIKEHANDKFIVDEDFNVPGYYVDSAGHNAAKERLNATGCMSYACALAYVLGGDKSYAEKSVELLVAWSTKNKKVSGDDGALSMSYIGPSLMYAAELLDISGGWESDSRDIFKGWVEAVFLPTANSIRERDNNWGDWGMLASVASYNFLGNKEELEKCFTMIIHRIENTILPTGEMPHETARDVNGIWYTYFALAPMTAACNIIYNVLGYDLFSYEGPKGQSIEKALDYLLYYCNHVDEWPHYSGKQSYVQGSSGYPRNLFEAMGVIYDNEEYTEFARQEEINTVLGHHYAWSFTTLTVVY